MTDDRIEPGWYRRIRPHNPAAHHFDGSGSDPVLSACGRARMTPDEFYRPAPDDAPRCMRCELRFPAGRRR